MRLDDLVLTPTPVVALLVSTSSNAACPRCATTTDRVHSHYRRTVADLPCHGRMLALRLLVRRFRCTNPAGPQHIFCERLPQLLQTHARSTTRLTDAHRDSGFALGGEAGSRLAERLDMPTSPDTLLRRVKNAADEPAPPPRYVAIDDWAFRKGQRYGTLVVDRERGRVLDLLPDRQAATVEKWLREHPGVEVISRDHAAAYAQGASAAAPQAQQVADRWHLWKNLREALERLLGRLAPDVAEALQPSSIEVSPANSTAGAASTAAAPERQPAVSPSIPLPTSEPVVSARRSAQQARRQQRVTRHAQVRLLREQGLSL